MIKYRPVRRSLSASIKEEETFHTMEEMLHFLRDRAQRIAGSIGSEPHEITGSASAEPDLLTGCRIQRCVFCDSICIGYFNETEASI